MDAHCYKQNLLPRQQNLTMKHVNLQQAYTVSLWLCSETLFHVTIIVKLPISSRRAYCLSSTSLRWGGALLLKNFNLSAQDHREQYCPSSSQKPWVHSHAQTFCLFQQWLCLKETSLHFRENSHSMSTFVIEVALILIHTATYPLPILAFAIIILCIHLTHEM